jgi:hypothetical protein
VSKTATHASNLLQLELANAAFAGGLALRGSSVAGSLAVSLWVGDPDAGGTECSYTGYARASVARDPASWAFVTNEARLAGNLNFFRRTDAGAGQTATWFALHDQDGTRIRKGQITTPAGGIVITQNVQPQLLATSTKVTES